MREEELRKLLASRKYGDAEMKEAVYYVREVLLHLSRSAKDLQFAGINDVVLGSPSVAQLRALALYSKLVGNDELYIRIAISLSGRNVLTSWAERAAEIGNPGLREDLLSEMEALPPGAGLDAFPSVTGEMLATLNDRLPAAAVKSVLTYNHHHVPAEAFADHPRILEERGIDGLLAHRRESLLSDLKEHARTGEIWYEQVITDEVVQYVESNPEIQAGVRHGGYIYASKIPFSPVEFLRETDPVKKRYLSCHCPLARESILSAEGPVSALVCQCSAGFEKFPFDIAFGQPTEVLVLSSVLAGDDICRFRIAIPGYDEASGKIENPLR